MNYLDRLEKMIGKDNAKKISDIKVLVVGIGGVGGAALEMLVRSGVNNIFIADFDTFEESNLNRQILSLRDNIGEKKIDVARKRILNINPNCNVTIYEDKINYDVLSKIEAHLDYIIDACDDINAKLDLVKYALKNGIKIISSCGTGNRMHPELLTISNIWKTEYDPLAKKFRSILRKENINYKLPVVYSKEQPVIKTSGSVGSFAVVPNAAGILLASYCLNDCLEDTIK